MDNETPHRFHDRRYILARCGRGTGKKNHDLIKQMFTDGSLLIHGFGEIYKKDLTNVVEFLKTQSWASREASGEADMKSNIQRSREKEELELLNDIENLDHKLDVVNYLSLQKGDVVLQRFNKEWKDSGDELMQIGVVLDGYQFKEGQDYPGVISMDWKTVSLLLKDFITGDTSHSGVCKTKGTYIRVFPSNRNNYMSDETFNRVNEIANVERVLAPPAVTENVPHPEHDTLTPVGENNRSLAIHFKDSVSSANLFYDSNLLENFFAAALSKPFTLLFGPTGSGKTSLAEALARWLVSVNQATNPLNNNEFLLQERYCLVSVGSNWQSTDDLLGYESALAGGYQRTPALDLILRASNNPNAFFTLILDEMNMSMIDHYFSKLLSAMESPHNGIHLHSQTRELNGVPSNISKFPDNLFIIGTLNADEAGKSISPKVVSRAHVFEVKSSLEDLRKAPDSTKVVDLEKILENPAGVTFSPEDRVKLVEKVHHTIKLNDVHTKICDTLLEEGEEPLIEARDKKEIMNFAKVLLSLGCEREPYEILDAALVQKLLPKIRGSHEKKMVLKRIKGWHDPGSCNLELSTGKVETMLQTLETYHYVKFFQ